jgi:hypothetical protein
VLVRGQPIEPPQRIEAIAKTNLLFVLNRLGRDGDLTSTKSIVSETYGDQEGTAYNGHFAYTCYHSLFGGILAG